MGNKSHILDFNAKNRPSKQPKESRPLPVLVKESRSIFNQELRAHLKKLVSEADDYLFDMSESGYNNAHFDAMRMLRFKKDGLLRSFQEAIDESFSDSLGKVESFDVDDDTMSFENIALVDDSELEEGIAIDSIVKKAHTENQDALEQLRTRLDTLVPSQTINRENNPFEPAFICIAFRDASISLDIDIESLLVIYKLFEREVIANLPEVYAKVNGFFIDKGVLPDLKINTVAKRTPPQQTTQAASANGATETGEGLLDIATGALPDTGNYGYESNTQTANDQVLNMMQGLLARSRPVVQAQPGTSVAPQPAAPIETQQLITALTNLQASQTALNATAANAGQFNIVANVRKDLVQQLDTSQQAIEGGALGQFNDDMIDIVSMLFDFILDDENVHPEVKAVIARLQIPMLKVGLVDRSFFSNKKHPARVLLNEIARTGISWEPEDADAQKVLERIEGLTEEITTNFTDDISIFTVMLNDFQDFRQGLQRRADIFERRTREAEEGKAKAENARSLVNKELEKLCRGKHIPDAVRDLLKNVWVHVMFLERLKDNDVAWDNAVKVAKLLIVSVQPIESQEKLDKLRKHIPALIKNLRKGFGIISLSPIEGTHLLEQLEDTHRQLMSDALKRIEDESKEEIVRLSPAAFGMAADDAESDLELKQGDSGEPEIEEIEIHDIGFSQSDTGFNEKANEQPVVELRPESIQSVERLTAGHWLEISIDGKPIRCKLAARISSTGKYIFVNRGGVKMAEFYTNELATEYQLGRVKLIDDEALFDRALESVISNLRAMKADA